MDTIDNAIPKETAEKLCKAIKAEYRGKWWTAAGLQCWGCTTFSKGAPEKTCLYSAAGYRGCDLVNTRYDHLRNIKNA